MADECSINTPYVYESLPAGEYTRIIELQPSEQESSPLRCKLRAVNLKEEVEVYDALSYTWGEPVYSQTLIVDDTSVIKITANLSDALHKFRLGRDVRRIWADAVSINQKDDVEKSQQIPRMAYIYLGAHRVIVWLGDYPEEGELLRRLHTLARQVTWAAVGTAEAEADSETSEKGSQSSIPTPSTPLEQAAQAFEKIIQLPWFSRRWIIQEVVLNADVSLYCSNFSISWV